MFLSIEAEGNIRPDFLFTYWIVIWFIVFVFLEPRMRAAFPNPLLAFTFGLMENVITFLLIINTVTMTTIIKFIIMIVITKVVPIYFLSRYSKINYTLDIGGGIILFLIYLYWLQIHNENVYDIYRNTLVSIQNNETRTPLFRAMASVGGI